MKPTKNRSALEALALTSLIALTLTVAHAAPISWEPATSIAADTDVSTDGKAVFAYNWNKSAVTVNGVSFTAPEEGVTTENAQGPDDVSSDALPFSKLSAEYQEVLKFALWSYCYDPALGPLPVVVTLNNLDVGRTYQVQIWMNHSRGDRASDQATVTSGEGNTEILRLNSDGSPGDLGQFVIGTFTADAPTQTIDLASKTYMTVLNALQLRIMPPSP